MKILKNKKYTILVTFLRYGFVAIFIFGFFAQFVFAAVGTGVSVKIDNPLGTTGPQTLPDFIAKIINVVLIVAVPVITLAIIYTGFLFVEARGNPEKLTKAKKALAYTLIGSALLLGALIIAEAIKITVNEIGSGA